MKKPKSLKELIEEIEATSQRKSLSDGYLEAYGYPPRAIGEYQGVVMVPEDWVLPYLKQLLKLSEQR